MKVLVCPLNWGLGHATRCVPILRRLIAEGHEPVIISDGFPYEFLKQSFPTLRFIYFPSYKVRYSANNSQIMAMIRNFPNIISGIIKEHFWLTKMLRLEHFDQVISDNRFGMWNKEVYSIYISHQIMVKMPSGLKILERLIWLFHRIIIHSYHECWIPDLEENNGLSGDLAHKFPLPKNAKFIGIQSRFSEMSEIIPDTSFEVVAIVSGLEPQRTIFEKNLIERFKKESFRTLIVSGQPEGNKISKRKIANVEIISHLQDNELAAKLTGAKKIISRSGYSTIMDLKVLNCLTKVEFIPTPGQTEQEYLASFLEKSSKKNNR